MRSSQSVSIFPVLPQPFDRLPEDIVRKIIFPKIGVRCTCRLLQACFPRCILATEWSRGRRFEYAFGVEDNAGFGCADRKRELVLMRGGVKYSLDEDCVLYDYHGLFLIMRWVLILSTQKKLEVGDSSRSVESWKNELLCLAFGLGGSLRA
jgi:hypothetical protein